MPIESTTTIGHLGASEAVWDVLVSFVLGAEAPELLWWVATNDPSSAAESHSVAGSPAIRGRVENEDGRPAPGRELAVDRRPRLQLTRLQLTVDTPSAPK